MRSDNEGTGATAPDGEALTSQAARLWAELRPQVRGVLGSDAMKSWIDPLTVLGACATQVRLAAANPVASARIRTDFLPTIQRLWTSRDPMGRRLLVEIRPGARATPDRGPRRTATALPTAPERKTSVLTVIEPTGYAPVRTPGAPRPARVLRSFDGFAVGEENRVAVTICRRVAEQAPRRELVCVSGPNGVGKTHLLEAIVARAQEAQPDHSALFLSAHEFVEGFTTALRAQNVNNFKDAIRTGAILVIDDIQFIIGKAASQLELFQTIAAVNGCGGTVVLSCDGPPEAIPGLTPRERSVLAGAFPAPIREPGHSLRREVARIKMAEFGREYEGFAVDGMVLDLIAARVAGTGRDVEGVVKSVIGQTAMVQVEATMDQVQRILAETAVAAIQTRALTVDQIKKRIAVCYSLSVDDLIGQCRKRSLARPRQLAMYLARKMANRSFPDIAARFGGRDHTTVMHAVKTVERLMLTEPAYAREVQDVVARITTMDKDRPN
jgi:chromosomal replication initiator protein